MAEGEAIYNQDLVRKGGGISSGSYHPVDGIYLLGNPYADATSNPSQTPHFEGIINYFRTPQTALDVRLQAQLHSQQWTEEELRIYATELDEKPVTRVQRDYLLSAFRSLCTSSVTIIDSMVLSGRPKSQSQRQIQEQEKYESASFQQNLAHGVLYASGETATDGFAELVFLALTGLEIAAKTGVGTDVLELNKWTSGVKNDVAVKRALSHGPDLHEVIMPQPFTPDIIDLDLKGIDGLALWVGRNRRGGFLTAFDSKSEPGILQRPGIPYSPALLKVFENIHPEIEHLYLIPDLLIIGPPDRHVRPSGLLTTGEYEWIKQERRKVKDVPPQDVDAYLASQILYSVWQNPDKNRMEKIRNRVKSYGQLPKAHEFEILKGVRNIYEIASKSKTLKVIR